MNNTVLNEVKNYLDITWNDYQSDTKIRGIVERADNYIKGFCDANVDYDTDKTAKQLFFDCCRYIWAGAFEDFEHNYSAQLLALQIGYEVKDHAES